MTLRYVLNDSGCAGRLSVGRVERAGPDQVKVYDSYGELFEIPVGSPVAELVRPWPGWTALRRMEPNQPCRRSEVRLIYRTRGLKPSYGAPTEAQQYRDL
jgi:hypothetical protein